MDGNPSSENNPGQGVIHCKKHIVNQEQNLEDEVVLKHELPL